MLLGAIYYITSKITDWLMLQILVIGKMESNLISVHLNEAYNAVDIDTHCWHRYSNTHTNNMLQAHTAIYGWLFDWCLTARQHRKINLCQLWRRETGSGQRDTKTMKQSSHYNTTTGYLRKHQ